MLNGLTEKFENTFRTLRGKGKLSEKNIQDALREIKLSLLTADVNVKVVKDFLQNVSEKALGQEVFKSLNPAQQFVKVVHDELVTLLGTTPTPMTFNAKPPVVIMCVGLQGSGKTTSVAKLANWCKSQGRRPLMVPVDLARPAAVEQLITLGNQNQIDTFQPSENLNPIRKAVAGVQYAKDHLFDTVIIDTAGRLHVDEILMDELNEMHHEISPHHVLFVLDAMVGQDALASAKQFQNTLQFTGVMLTKLDGDARGGAVFSVKYQMGVPIYFIGTGEKIDAFEPFYPDRMASRILGMGDVVSLVENVQKEMDAESLLKAKRIFSADFSLDDFADQLGQVKDMEKVDKWLKLLPGAGKLTHELNANRGTMERDVKHKIAILSSMTPQERAKPKILNGSRRKRIAKGSGSEVRDVNRLLKEFETMKTMMKQMKRRGGLKNKLGGLFHGR